uniref:Putative nucleic-acid-binding protein from transposon x-element panstrongylus lignarius n=1 Tax=Rhodnius prolixus TaxID=13249 RepID=A0A4V0Y8P3_RHOPR
MDGGDGAETDLNISVYVTSHFDGSNGSDVNEDLNRLTFEEAIRATGPSGPWRIKRTNLGLIASFTLESDAITLMKSNLEQYFGTKIQHALFYSKDCRFKQTLFLRDVPYAIPIQEIKNALERQGITALSVDRVRQHVRIEVSDPGQCETLLRYGLDFFGVTRFHVVLGRWRPLYSRLSSIEQQQESVLQCYRCQGFWHIAANCQQMTRCVRCGGAHTVEACTRPRNDPICCHCSGPHHAAYKQCPVRLHVANTPFAITVPRLQSEGPYMRDS